VGEYVLVGQVIWLEDASEVRRLIEFRVAEAERAVEDD
jgi:hypothetical protein